MLGGLLLFNPTLLTGPDLLASGYFITLPPSLPVLGRLQLQALLEHIG